MRILCDSCESAIAILFCAADEAALCKACDDKVHMCNKLASRHLRVGLATPSEVPRCDVCESAPAFFFCEIDGSSLCLQCDMVVHVGGKRTHKRYLRMKQGVEFPGDKPNDVNVKDPNAEVMEQVETTARGQNEQVSVKIGLGGENEKHQNLRLPPVSSASDRHSNRDAHSQRGIQVIDLNL